MPKILPDGVIQPYVGSPDLEGASPYHAHIVENPCNRINELFSDANGEIRSVDMIVKESKADPNASTERVNVYMFLSLSIRRIIVQL